jgi:hypothetical protein
MKYPDYYEITFHIKKSDVPRMRDMSDPWQIGADQDQALYLWLKSIGINYYEYKQVTITKSKPEYEITDARHNIGSRSILPRKSKALINPIPKPNFKRIQK